MTPGSPVVLEVGGSDLFDALLRPGLVLHPIRHPIPPQACVPAPASEVPLGLALAALTGIPTLPVGLQGVVAFCLFLLLEHPCGALEFQYPGNLPGVNYVGGRVPNCRRAATALLAASLGSGVPKDPRKGSRFPVLPTRPFSGRWSSSTEGNHDAERFCVRATLRIFRLLGYDPLMPRSETLRTDQCSGSGRDPEFTFL